MPSRLLVLALLMAVVPLAAQVPPPTEWIPDEPAASVFEGDSAATAQLPPAPAPVVRRFDPGQLDKYRSDEDFQYAEGPAPPPEMNENSFWSKLMRLLGSYLSDVFSGAMTPATIITYVILVGVVVFIILVLVRGQGTKWGARKVEKAKEVAYEEMFEAIEGVDFAGLIAKAERAADLRAAVRLHYLWVLQRLSERGIIEWKVMKTNRDYLYELGHTALRADFEPLLRFFEYVWYGEFPLDQAQYAEWSARYRAVLEKVPAPTKPARSA